MPKRWSLKPVCLPVPPQERRAGKENRTPRTTLEVLGITTIRYPHGRGGIRTPEKPLCKSGALGHYATRPLNHTLNIYDPANLSRGTY